MADRADDEFERWDYGTFSLGQTKIPPRTFSERVRLAIGWCWDYHDRDEDPDDELGAELMRHLRHVGLKLVWLDGREVTKEQLRHRS
jgi:hypothetical protein